MKQFGIRSFDEIDLVVTDYICHPKWEEDFYKTPCRKDVFLANFPQEKIVTINHHLAHAHAVYFSSGFRRAAILIVDGRGSDKETQSLYVADGRTIRLIATTSVIGIGLFYAAVTQAIGFGLLQEGKTMGLAPYGADVKMKVFDIPRSFDGIVTDYSEACVEGNYDLRIPFPPMDTFEAKARAAFEVQQECEEAMMHLARWAREVTGEENLCISGGVGLNSVANYKLLMSGIFKDVFVNPAASDTGIPLGAALFGYHHVLQRERNYDEISAFLGPSYDRTEIESAIAAHKGFAVERSHAVNKAVEMLAQNKIVACLFDRSEIGPRALGNRSILMSPLRAENKDILNSRVKHREAFRPFAPVILEERTSEYFDMDRPCPYMLFVPDVRPEKRSVIPAVTHVDGTGRLQTVTEKRNPLFYRITKLFGEKTGVPVLLNTSFNDNNEPIVETPKDAVRCFLGTNIDALLIGGDILLVK
ncbi:carbamoyltransferase C-terminal domain-containing protein [Noviherbaspirillum sp.]|uniref:carbamoyltransferase family protein n=1 Tax=Noviherbaspirillum sp. TaxID=1926288 RepID=UPI0025F4E0C3|nr:carbamoyltransferase C-terminal domain-containing protein [Noviherbaspirillum sp.]